MLFALVDDAVEILEYIPNLIKKIIPYYDVKIDCFQNAPDFLDAYRAYNYDALFLDIDMPEINGFDLTCKIKNKNRYIPLVYVTGREDLITHAFRYKPIGFVRKQYLKSELPYAVQTILKELNKENPRIKITEIRSCGGNTHLIEIREIAFIESNNHYLNFHLLTGKVFCIRDSLSHYTEKREFKDFIYINSGTIVNLEHIKLINDTVSFEDGTTLYISRRKLQSVIKSYLKFTKRVLI